MVELDVDDIGPSLRYAKAAVTKTPSDRPASSPAPSAPSSPSTPSSPASPPAEADPWASAAPAGAAPASAGSRYDDEPPF